MKRTTKRTTERNINRFSKRNLKRSSFVVGVALALSLMPGAALAHADSVSFVGSLQDSLIDQAVQIEASAAGGAGSATLVARVRAIAQAIDAERADKTLAYDPADIAAIGTQETSGHTICCPSFSCAYADAVMDGTVRDHSYYTCSSCSWPDWGGGNSAFRSVGTDEQLLREAYDQIAAGRPTVIHVRASYGEHWIALIGYRDVVDPDCLTLANFTALDPWDGAQVIAADRFALYGDGCEHISSR